MDLKPCWSLDWPHWIDLSLFLCIFPLLTCVRDFILCPYLLIAYTFPVPFAHLFSFCLNWGMLKNEWHHKHSDPAFLMTQNCICTCHPGGIKYSIHNLYQLSDTILRLTASHSSPSYTPKLKDI